MKAGMVSNHETLDDFVDRMRAETGYGKKIPCFSRYDGREKARCLFLFETPNQVAVDRGYAERENQDPSARNFENASGEAKLDRTLTISWNIVPWQNPKPSAAVIREALPWLGELLEILQELRVVVLCGETAQRATQYLYRHHEELCVLHAPHPSARGLGIPERREHFWAAVQKAAKKARAVTTP